MQDIKRNSVGIADKSPNNISKHAKNTQSFFLASSSLWLIPKKHLHLFSLALRQKTERNPKIRADARNPIFIAIYSQQLNKELEKYMFKPSIANKLEDIKSSE